MLGPHIPSHVPTSTVSSQSTSVGVLGAHRCASPGSTLTCAPVRAWCSHPPQPCSSGRLSCKGFLALLQHVSPKSDFTIPVVSFLNVCKGKRRNAVQSPLSNATTQQVAVARPRGAVPEDTPSECSCSETVGTPALSQGSAWDPSLFHSNKNRYKYWLAGYFHRTPKNDNRDR